jgi:hypothetical protein
MQKLEFCSFFFFPVSEQQLAVVKTVEGVIGTMREGDFDDFARRKVDVDKFLSSVLDFLELDRVRFEAENSITNGLLIHLV